MFELKHHLETSSRGMPHATKTTRIVVNARSASTTWHRAYRRRADNVPRQNSNVMTRSHAVVVCTEVFPANRMVKGAMKQKLSPVGSLVLVFQSISKYLAVSGPSWIKANNKEDKIILRLAVKFLQIPGQLSVSRQRTRIFKVRNPRLRYP